MIPQDEFHQLARFYPVLSLLPAPVQIVTASGQPRPGDLNGDGQVSVTDLSLAGAAWNSAAGGAGWDPRLDRNGDWRIDVGEVQWVAARWGM